MANAEVITRSMNQKSDAPIALALVLGSPFLASQAQPSRLLKNRENREVAFSGEAANDDSLGLSERPASAGSAALGNGALMSLALKARKN